MQECFLCRYSFFRIGDKHLIQKIDSLITQLIFCKQFSKLVSLMLSILDINCIFQSFKLRPRLFCGRANGFEYEVQLLQLRFASKKGLFQDDLCHNAANRPDVNLRRVHDRSQEELRRSIPHCNNLLSHHRLRCLSRQPEITNFQDSFIGIQKIGCLQIAVYDLFLMQIIHSFDKIFHQFLDLTLAKGYLLQQLFKLMVDILHNDENTVFLLISCHSGYLHNVGMINTPKNRNLSQRGNRKILALHKFQFFDSDSLFGWQLYCSIYYTKRPFMNFIESFVVLY